jgi:AbrB family looped-hinge helix DNA binding protein
MLQSKVFANGSTTLPKPVREALGVKAGDTVRYVISDNGVQIVKAQSVPETADMPARNGQS